MLFHFSRGLILSGLLAGLLNLPGVSYSEAETLTPPEQSLTRQLKEFNDNFRAKATPERLKILEDTLAEIGQAGIEKSSLKAGQAIPLFALPNAEGKTVHIRELLSKGPVVIAFYRGKWCPYCNLQLHALQKHVGEIQGLGATLVAISPQKPEHSLSVKETAQLTFEVLSDSGNAVARQFGIVFTLPQVAQGFYRTKGLDLKSYNGDDSYTLPVPATFIVNAEGVIVYSDVHTDYTKRLDPQIILNELKKQE